ncbi:hypothetical protein V6Z12_A05G352700, partial [Gossypium hirsutum]
MGFIFALLIASLFVDKAGSEFSFIPRHNLYPCASYSPGVHSQKYSHPYPLTSIPRTHTRFVTKNRIMVTPRLITSFMTFIVIE